MKAHWLDKGGDITTETLHANGVYSAKISSSPEAYRAPLDRVKDTSISSGRISISMLSSTIG